MRSPVRVRRLLAWTAVALAACSDNPSAPTAITNPAALILDMFAVDSAFQSDAFRALQDLPGFTTFPVAPLPLARLAEALRVPLPRAPGRATEGTLGRNLPRPFHRDGIR